MTAEQLHDALGLLPSDLVAQADALRQAPRKHTIPLRRWSALAAAFVLVAGCGLFALRSGLLPLAGGGKSAAATDKVAMQEAAPEAPAAMAPTEAPGEIANNSLSRDESFGDICDCAPTLTEEAATPTQCMPPVDVAAAEYRFGALSVNDEVHLIKNPAGLEALGLEPDLYDEDWFMDFDLLLIALPGITSQEGLTFSVGQGSDPTHWQIRIGYMPELRVDTGDSLLILIPVDKGHIPRDTEFELIWE